ncbi:MAG: C4-type zinc ribbon domain-containing protein [bacterium]
MESGTKDIGVLTTIEKLLVVQDRDRKLRQLSRESEDIPARKKLIETRLQEHRKALHGAREELMKNASGAKQLELDIESMQQRILKFRDQQGQIKTNEEYRALEREIGVIQQNIRAQEDSELVLMEAAEGIRQKITQFDQKLKQEDAIVKSDASALDERMKNIQGEIDKLKVDRDGLTPDIEPDWLARYDRTFKHTGDFAIVPIENSSCGGCHMKLPPQITQDVKKGLSMIVCGFCGRILYWRP